MKQVRHKDKDSIHFLQKFSLIYNCDRFKIDNQFNPILIHPFDPQKHWKCVNVLSFLWRSQIEFDKYLITYSGSTPTCLIDFSLWGREILRNNLMHTRTNVCERLKTNQISPSRYPMTFCRSRNNLFACLFVNYLMTSSKSLKINFVSKNLKNKH